MEPKTADSWGSQHFLLTIRRHDQVKVLMESNASLTQETKALETQFFYTPDNTPDPPGSGMPISEYL